MKRVRAACLLPRRAFNVVWLVLALGSAAGLAGAEPAPPTLALTLRPAGAPADPDHVDATLVLTGVAAVVDTPFLAAPMVIAGTRAVAYGDSDVSASDAAGPLPLVITEDSEDATGYGQMRRFRATRASQGDVTVRFRVAIPPPGTPRRSGPPFDVRRESGGWSGAGYGFLPLPIDERRFHITVHWDLTAMAPGAIGVTSLGAGDVATDAPLDELFASYFMAGPLGRYPADAGALPFQAYWLGTPPFDIQAVMAWAAREHAALGRFFHDEGAPPFYMLARAGSIPRSGGAALTNSFMIGYGTEPQSEESLRFLLAHEMAHHWAGVIPGPNGATSWFSEGLAEFYKLRVPLLAGLIDADAFAAELARSTRRYYANPRNRLPNDSIPAGFWRDSNVRTIPYQRGLMYWADLDSKVRAHSQGRRSVDDLVFTMIDAREHGRPHDTAAWTALVEHELGPRGREEFEAMLGGALIVPPDDAFGPCFRRVTVKAPRYELGFAEESFLARPPVVQGLVAGSAAARAGLRDGDAIVRRDEVEPSQTDADTDFTLDVKRGDAVVPIRYRPRAEPLTRYEWVRKPSVNGPCAR